ncbi:MAG: T9SS type A sorting domain-containing protein [Bacteroidales bacterium]|nr:T9SS type A sorting domain-containing protein [Bacteroidales bacterium]
MKKVTLIIILNLLVCSFISLQAENTKKQRETKSANIDSWEEMGPDNVGGRTNVILIDKDNSLKIYAGSAGGGLWMSTSGGAVWKRVESFPETSISAIAQSDDGILFVGTGEGLNPGFADPGVLYPFGIYGRNANFGMTGSGIYKSVGDSFIQLSKTTHWEEINDLAYNEKNKTLYAATDYGLQVSTDNGETWTNAKTVANNELDLIGTHITTATDGTAIYVQRDRGSRNGSAFISDGSSTTNFKQVELPEDAGSVSFAFAPSDPNYLYASVADKWGAFLGIYQSTNKGDSFRVIVPGGSTLIDAFNGGGDYCNSIIVFPNDPHHILVGGYPLLWEGIQTGENSFFAFNSILNLAGIQSFTFDPKNENNLFVGCNIGIAMGRYNGSFFQFNLMNKNYGTAQYTTVSFSNDDKVLGGTRENGTLFITKEGNTEASAVQLTSGYASQTVQSMINTHAFFYTTTYGTCYRQASLSSDPEEIKDWFSRDLMLGGTLNQHTKWSYNALKAACRSSQYISPIAMWESINDPNSTDTVVFVADKDYKKNEQICVRSNINNYPMWTTAPKDLEKKESITFTDYVQNRFFVGGGGFVSTGLIGAPVFMTKSALNFTAPPVWYRVFFTGDTTEQVTNLCISEDGNHLFVSTFSSSSASHNIYRVSGFDLARDSMTLSYGRPTSSGNVIENPNCLLDAEKIYSTNSFISSINLHPKNNDVLVVTIGGNNLEPHIYASTNATSASSGNLLDIEDNPKEGSGLPDGKTPIYTALIEMTDTNIAFVGTEKGVYMTENFSSNNPTWVEANNGIGTKTPVFMIKQQTKNYPDDYAIFYGEDTNDIVKLEFKGVKNAGCIYAATYGRGIFKNETYQLPGTSIVERSVNKKSYDVSIFPNPARDEAKIKYTLADKANNLTLSLYDITGKKIFTQNIGSRLQGDNIEIIQCNTLQNGLYFITIQGDNLRFTSKLIISK